MSSFKCEKCGAAIIDTPQGYITECEHYPLKAPTEEPRKVPYGRPVPPVTPDDIRKIVEMYPTRRNEDIAATLNLSIGHLNVLVIEMRRQGLVLKKKRRETTAVYRIAIKDYIKSRHATPQENNQKGGGAEKAQP